MKVINKQTVSDVVLGLFVLSMYIKLAIVLSLLHSLV